MRASGRIAILKLIYRLLSDALGLQVWYPVGGVLTSAVAVALFFVPAVANIEQGRTLAAADPES